MVLCGNLRNNFFLQHKKESPCFFISQRNSSSAPHGFFREYRKVTFWSILASNLISAPQIHPSILTRSTSIFLKLNSKNPHFQQSLLKQVQGFPTLQTLARKSLPFGYKKRCATQSALRMVIFKKFGRFLSRSSAPCWHTQARDLPIPFPAYN